MAGTIVHLRSRNTRFAFVLFLIPILIATEIAWASSNAVLSEDISFSEECFSTFVGNDRRLAVRCDGRLDLFVVDPDDTGRLFVSLISSCLFPHIFFCLLLPSR